MTDLCFNQFWLLAQKVWQHQTTTPRQQLLQPNSPRPIPHLIEGFNPEIDTAVWPTKVQWLDDRSLDWISLRLTSHNFPASWRQLEVLQVAPSFRWFSSCAKGHQSSHLLLLGLQSCQRTEQNHNQCIRYTYSPSWSTLLLLARRTSDQVSIEIS